MKDLLSYLKQQLIRYHDANNDRIAINNQTYQLVKPNKDNRLFDEKFHLLTEATDCNFYVFCFGTKWYYCEDAQKVELNPLKYIGKAKQEIETYNFLGVRGSYELLNGSRLYKDWCKKAKFLGVKTLGICEKNTLAGTLKFQLECKKNEIKSVLGATYTVWREAEDYRYDIKLYAKNEKGWENLLLINKEVLVTNTRFIKEVDLFKLLDGLFIVFDPKSIEFEKVFPWDLTKEDHYYQLDTVEYKDNERDKWYLENLKKFYHSKMKPVAITDAFYLDKEDSYIKQKLNSIGGFHEYISGNQYFKGKEDYFYELQELFGENDFDNLVNTYDEAIKNESWITANCNFQIETGKKHLPRYIRTEEEKKKFKTNEDLFWYLIEQGLKERGLEGRIDEELERIEKEFEIINYGNLVDYFLINWEQTKFCKENGILQGIGRGSSSGFLITHLLDITKIHPFEYNLIAERFLTKERALNKIADVDCDYTQARRDDVKNHLQDKYGYNQCCSVGTYSTLQLKAAFKDLAKLEGVEFQEANTISLMIGDCESITDIFKLASERERLKNFIIKYPNIFNDLYLVLEARKSKSIHASAFMITPKEKEIFNWMPVRVENKDGESILVSEWEGYDLEDAGMLKQDILGLKQLDKFQGIIDLVKQNTGKNIDIYNLPLDEPKVYDYLSKGYNEDVFQFGTHGLSGYCQELKPTNINDLIAAVALYRPGTMENNFHNMYILRKEGKQEVEYFSGTENILKDTYGLLVYQEDIMFICQKLAGFDLAITDKIRSILGKKLVDQVVEYKDKFVSGAVKNGYDKEEMGVLWDTMAKFAGYGFNKSHAAAYAITGYISQYLKVKYPIEFWAVALNMLHPSKKDEKLPSYISEINKTGDIKVLPPEINISETSTKIDFDSNIIYWELSAIKGLGDVATTQIMEDKAKNGEYFSLDEFIDRHTFKGSKVNKTHYENLIMAGAFDKIENIVTSKDRLKLIEQFRKTKDVKIKPTDNDIIRDNKDKLDYNWWWNLQQKRLSGLAFFDYPILYNNYFENQNKYPYTDFIQFNEEKSGLDRLKACIAGYVVEIDVRNSPKGDYARITLENNYDFYSVTVWAEQYEHFQDILLEAKGNLMLINGNVVNYKGSNVLQTNDESTVIILS